MREILLTKGFWAHVDDDEYERINSHKWCVTISATTGKIYAVRSIVLPNGKRGHTSMHREVMGLEYGDKRKVDHICNMQTLNNCKSNLRLCSTAENAFNSLPHKDNRSGFKGVSWGTKDKKWITQVNKSGRRVFRKGFSSVRDAAQAYMLVSYIQHGEFSYSGAALQ